MAKNVQQNYASQAYLKMAMVSPQRCRLVAELVRGKSLDAAHRMLLLEKVKSAKLILTLLKSAVANAQQKGVADLDRLYVSEIQVNEGPRIKRHMPRAQGRADVRLTRTSHVILQLSEKKAAVRKTGKAKTEAEAKKSNNKGDR